MVRNMPADFSSTENPDSPTFPYNLLLCGYSYQANNSADAASLTSKELISLNYNTPHTGLAASIGTSSTSGLLQLMRYQNS
jgi:hypothetical protein